jgi:hypothetical protein
MITADLTPSWCDPVAVERTLAGRTVGRQLHHAERVEVIRRVLEAGGAPNEALVLLRCNGENGRVLVAEAMRPRRGRAA